MQKIDHFVISATLRCLTGLRIGGSDDLLQIGGTDLTCIKNPVTLEPYIPGSSLKGKLRSELEKRLGKFGGVNGDEPCGCAKTDCPICRVFGPHKKSRHDLGPTRIIVRDAKLLTGGQIETKSENIIDRRVGTALHPRKIERVVPEFTFAIRIGRLTDATGDNPLFSVSEVFLQGDGHLPTGLTPIAERPYLSVYLRVADDRRAFVLDLFHALSETGFGRAIFVSFGQ